MLTDVSSIQLGSISQHPSPSPIGIFGLHPILQFFSNPPPIKTDAPHGAFPHLKMKPPPSEKYPPLKRETPFHEMIPRKSTLNKNSKICVKKFIFSKFAGLQAYSQQLYYQMNSFTGIFQQHFKSPMLPPCIDLSSPNQILKSTPPLMGGTVPHVLNTCGKLCSQLGVTASSQTPQLQSLHHKVMLMWDWMPKLNSCIIPLLWWIGCMSCLFRIFWNLWDCSLDLNHAWVSSANCLFLETDLRLMLLQ